MCEHDYTIIIYLNMSNIDYICLSLSFESLHFSHYFSPSKKISSHTDFILDLVAFASITTMLRGDYLVSDASKEMLVKFQEKMDSMPSLDSEQFLHLPTKISEISNLVQTLSEFSEVLRDCLLDFLVEVEKC